MARAFVGRETELEALAGALDDALGGLTRVVLISGEPGIGKTRLAEELAARATASSAIVVWGRAWDEGGCPPGWPWLSILNELSAAVPGARARCDDALAALQTSSSAAERFATLETVVRALEHAASIAPVLAIVDDLHWADATTLATLKLVGRTLRRARLLVVGTYRDVEARVSPAHGRALADVARDARALALGPLSEAEVAALVAPVGPGAVVERVHRATRGNPFFVDELVRSGSVQGMLDDATVPLPDGARAMVLRRLDALSAPARALLVVAAAVGSEIDAVLLRDAGARAGIDDVAGALAVAQRHGVLSPARSGKLAFSHDIVRETVVAEAEPKAMADAHRALAVALIASAGDAAAIARHLLACEDPAGVERAIEAGRAAVARGAYEDAASLFERALQLWSAMSDPDARTVELMLALADALGGAGHGTRASQTCSRAADIAKRLGSAQLFARAALGYAPVTRFGMVDRAHVELLEAALAMLRDDPPLRAVLLARLASASQPSPRPEEPVALARDAIAAARDLGDARVLLRVLDTARPAFRALDDVGERATIDAETLRLADEAADVATALRARQRLATTLLERGDPEACAAHLDVVERLGVEHRRPSVLLQAAFLRISCELLWGNHDEAERWLRTAKERYVSLPDPDAVLPGGPLALARITWLRARARVEDETELGMGPVPSGPFADILLASSRAHAGRLDEARGAVDRLFARGDHVTLNYLPRAVLPEVVAALDDAPRAEALLPLVEPLDGRNVAAFGGLCEGSASRLLGMLHATLRRFDAAERCFERAEADNVAMRAAPFVHKTRLARAEMLVRRGGPGDRAAANALLVQAAEGFESLGMTTKVARARALLDGRVGPVAIETREASWPRASLRREGDVWTIDVAGETRTVDDVHGLHYIAHLVASRGAEVHVADLAAVVRGEDAELGGDAGPALDRAAKDAYRRRVADLRDALDEATAFGDAGRAERARVEMEALTEELARAVGLGKRDRRASSRSERQRVNVTLRIRKAIKKIAGVSPRLGEHLDRSIRTGTFCAYEPVPGLTVTT